MEHNYYQETVEKIMPSPSDYKYKLLQKSPNGLRQDEQLTYGDYDIASDRDFLARVLDNIDALVIVLDHTGKIILINRACERLFGFSDDVMRDKLKTGILRLPGQTENLNNLIEILRSSNRHEHYETEWVDNIGTKRTIAWSINTLMNFYGQLEYIFASGIDITGRKKAEYLLMREQILLKSLINSIPDMIFYKDLNGIYLGCNTVFENLIQRKAIDIIDHTDLDIQPPERACWYSEIDRHVIETRNVFTYENWLKNPEGEPVLVETIITPYYDKDGEPLGVIGVGRDITQHHIIEEKLRTAKSEFEQLISSLSSVMLVLNKDEVISHWNPMAEKIFCIPASTAVGQKLADLPISWDWKVIEQGIRICKAENRPNYLDPMRFKRPNGQDGYLGVSISPLIDSRNIVTGFIFLCSDITDRKAMETQLAQAQKLESIGRLAAGIAHEINTPIQFIGDNVLFLQNNFRIVFDLLFSYKNVLESIITDDETNRIIKNLNSEASSAELDYLKNEIPLSIDQTLEGVRRVADIVRTMKEFSHPGLKGKILMDVNKALIDTLTVTRNQWKLVAEVETVLAPNLPKVMCQPAEINQVFLNIIVNAAQAIESAIEQGKPSPGKITIVTDHIDNWVEIRISDTGLGIPEDIQPHIFDPFFTTKDPGKGTGQGLAFSYDIINRKHDGSITFKSTINCGTTFNIRLPI